MLAAGIALAASSLHACGAAAWQSSSFACAPRRRALVGAAGAALAGRPWTASADSPDFLKNLGPGRKVVDLGNVLSTAQEAELEKAIAVLERDTPYRFRVLSPPPGRGPENKADWTLTAKAVKDYWAQDAKWDGENVVVLLANPTVVRGKSTNPVNFSVANKLTERLQYRIASDTFTKIANKFGSQGSLKEIGDDGAVVESAMNAIACLRRGVCMQAIPEQEARELALGLKDVVLTPDEEGALKISRARQR